MVRWHLPGISQPWCWRWAALGRSVLPRVLWLPTQGCHLDSATLLLIVPVISIPGLPENIKPLKTCVRETLIFIKRLFFQKAINITYLIFFFFSPRILQESLNW